ncbi:hypothetical protein AAGS39_15650 [Flavobacterium sp. CGRL2]
MIVRQLKKTADNYPTSEFYKTDELLTSLGIGEALVTALNEKGVPTPLVATMMRAPQSRMDILSASEIDEINNKSKLVKKYAEEIDRESAYELLTKKIESANQATAEQEEQAPTRSSKAEPSTASVVGKSVLKVVTSATFIRGVFGVLTKIFKK